MAENIPKKIVIAVPAGRGIRVTPGEGGIAYRGDTVSVVKEPARGKLECTKAWAQHWLQDDEATPPKAYPDGSDEAKAIKKEVAAAKKAEAEAEKAE